MLPLISANIADSQRVPKKCIGCRICTFFGGGGGRFLLALLSSMDNPIGWHYGLLCLYCSTYNFERWLFYVDCYMFMTVQCERGVSMAKGRKDPCWSTTQSTYTARVPLSVSVPSSKLWPPAPIPQANVSPWNQRGGDTLVCRWGRGVPMRTTQEKS